MKTIDDFGSLPDDRIAGLEITTGIPLVYQLGPDLTPEEVRYEQQARR